jgi:hypothetical protein
MKSIRWKGAQELSTFIFFGEKKKKKMFKSSSLKPLNQIKPNLAEMVLD